MSNFIPLPLLLVSNGSDERGIYRHWLEQDSQYAYDIVECATGAAALHWCQQSSAAVVLLDWHLPDWDGVTFLQALGKSGDIQPIVIVVSHQDAVAIAVAAMQHGAHDYLVKRDLTPERLLQAIHQAIERQSRPGAINPQALSPPTTAGRARSQPESTLQESEERLRLALMAANQGLYDLNVQTGEAIVNAEYAVMLGYDPATFHETNAKWIERLHPDDHEIVAQTYRDYIAGKRAEYKVEFRQRTQSGEWKWILSLGKLVAWDEAGQPLRMLGTHTDISDRKRTEVASQQAEKLKLELQLLESILEVTMAGYWDWNIVTNEEYLSPTFKRMFGYADHELPNVPETWQTLIFPEDLPRVLACFNEHVSSRGQVPYYNEVRYRHKDGSTVWVICSGKVIEWDAAGQPLRMIGCHFDITERKRIEQLLAASEARYRAIVEDQTELIARYLPNGTLLFVNEAYCRYFDVRREDVIGKHYAPVLYDVDREHVMRLAQSMNADNPTVTIENRVIINGEVRWTQWVNRMVFDEQGQVIECQSVGRDINEHKQAEANLRDLSDRLTLALKSGAIGLWEWDVERNVLTWDDRMYDLYGIAPNEFSNIYAGWSSRLHTDDREVTEAAIQKALANEKEYNIEFRIVRPDGRVRFIKANALVQRDSQGEPLRMVGINYDITDSKLVEAELERRVTERTVDLQQARAALWEANELLERRVQERTRDLEALAAALQRSNQDLEQFAYIASHDLQEPLRTITSYTQLFARKYQGHLDEKAEKYIHYVVDGASRMQQLIRDLLSYSRVGRHDSKRNLIDCHALLNDVTANLQVAIAETQAVIEHDYLPTVTGDYNQLLLLFQNLISNAIKYRSSAPPHVHIVVKPQSDSWLFAFADNGIGIEPIYHDRIFGIFQRLHTRTEYSGTGLGLAICKRIVEQHDGSIWVESQLGGGSVFCFTLPFHPANGNLTKSGCD